MLKAVTNLVNVSQITGVLPVVNGGTGVTTSTGTGNVVLSAAPTLSGNVTLSTGNLIIGTSGKGIDFSATSGAGTSELFADYEEGTWTPSFAKSGGSTPTQTSTGTYTIIGNIVYFSFICTFSSAQTEASYFDTTFVSQSGVTFINVGTASIQGTSAQFAIEAITSSRLRVYLTGAAITTFTGFGALRV